MSTFCEAGPGAPPRQVDLVRFIAAIWAARAEAWRCRAAEVLRELAKIPAVLTRIKGGGWYPAVPADECPNCRAMPAQAPSEL